MGQHASGDTPSRAAEVPATRPDFLRSVIDTDPSLIFAKDSDGVFTLANRALATMYGTTPEELVGKTDADFNPDPTEVERFLRDDREVMESGRSKLIPEEPVTHSETGETRWFQTRKIPLDLPDGSRQVLGVAVDITERRRAEEELRKSETRYREASQVKSEFLTTMSHELRTPLNAIIGYADLLELGVPESIPAKAVAQVDRIGHSARHLLELIEEILTYSRTEAGRETVEVEAKDLRQLVGEVTAVIEPLASEAGLELRVLVPPEPVELRTDSPKLRRILLNLLSNAVKFTRKGRVEIRARVEKAFIVFDIEDTGIGIAAEHLGRVFDPFWQANRSRTREVEGTGLGLSISQRTARMLGGELGVQSRVGEGTTFTLRLPLQLGSESGSPGAAGV
jgi:PAS domain S-box-containing protein